MEEDNRRKLLAQNITVARWCGNCVKVSQIGIPMDVVTSALQMLRPSGFGLRAEEFGLTAKCATMYLPRGGNPSTIANLCSHAANKPVDVLIYMKLDPAQRSFAFIEVDYNLPADPERLRDIRCRGGALNNIVIFV